MRDFLKPEIVLFGVEDKEHPEKVRNNFIEHYIINHSTKPQLKM